MITSSPSPALIPPASRNASAHSSLRSYAASKSPSPAAAVSSCARSSSLSHNTSPDPSAAAPPAAFAPSSSASSSIASSPVRRHQHGPPQYDWYVRPATVDAATQVSPEGALANADRGSDRPSAKRKDPSGSPEQRNPTTIEPSLGPQEAATGGGNVAEATGSGTTSPSKRVRGSESAKRQMPARYEQCDVRDLVRLIAAMLMELIRFNDQIPLADGRLTRFHSRAPPGISVADYLQRLATHATLSPPLLLSMVYYIDRLCALYDRFTISSLTVHRFLIASATVASKGLSDLFWTNRTYARVGGITPRELKILELEFLTRMEWRIVPQPEVLAEYYRSLITRSDEYELDPNDDGVEVQPEQPTAASER